MKCVLLVVTVTLSLGATAQKLSANKVSFPAKTAFEKAHPGTKGSWEMEGKNYEVNFKENGKNMSCVINKDGKIMETETVIATAELPEAASQYLKAHYKNAKLHDVARVEKANGEINFEAEVNGKDVVFDMNGKFIKTEKE